MSVDIAEAVFAAMEAGDFESASSQLADNFTFSGPVPEPVGKQEWLGLQMAMKQAFPDWSFNSHMHAHGDVIHTTVQITGTHNGDLDLSAMGMPVIPATGTAISLPQEELNITVENGMLTSLIGEPTPGGGVMGILSQLGVEPPG